MIHKPANETWFQFMDRAKRNGVSPYIQERVDLEYELEECLNLWSRYSCDCLGWAITCLRNSLDKYNTDHLTR